MRSGRFTGPACVGQEEVCRSSGGHPAAETPNAAQVYAAALVESIASHPEWRSQHGHVDLPRIRKGGLDALFFGVVVRRPTDGGQTGPITGPRAVHNAIVQVAAVHKLPDDLPNDGR